MKASRPVCAWLMLAVCALTARADDWPLPRHDAGNTGFTAQRLAPPLRLAWRVPTNRAGRTLMASGGVVCQGDERSRYTPLPSTLYNAADGRVVWTLPGTTPVYLRGRRWIVATHRPGGDTLDSYDWTTRQKQWSYSLGGRWDSVTVGGGTLYVGLGGVPPEVALVPVASGAETERLTLAPNDSSHVLAVWNQNVALGGVHWMRFRDRATFSTGFGVYDGGTSVLLYGSYAVGQGWGHWATGIDLTTRRAVWKRSVWRDAANSLVKGPGGRMLVLQAQASPAAVLALDITTGDVVWNRPLIAGNGAMSQPSAGAWDVAYVPGGHQNVPGGPRGGFYALNGATGKVLWAYEKPGVQGVAVIVSDGALYGLDTQGFLYKFVR